MSLADLSIACELTYASMDCERHRKRTLPLRCVSCSPQTVKCISCILEHTLAYPSHSLELCDHDDVSWVRPNLTALVSETAEVACKVDSVNPPPSAGCPSSVLDSHETATHAASAVELATSPLVERARSCVVSVQAGLDELASNTEASLVQLEANRDAALAALDMIGEVDPAAIQAVFSSGVDAVQAASAAKRTALETELVAADAALGEAVAATASLAEVRG